MNVPPAAADVPPGPVEGAELGGGVEGAELGGGVEGAEAAEGEELGGGQAAPEQVRLEAPGAPAADRSADFSPADCRSWVSRMNLKGYVPLAGALIGIVVHTSLLVTGTQPGRGTLWISIVTSLLLGLFLMVMMMAAQFADSNLAVRGLIVLVLLGLAFNVFVNFMALTEREGLAMDSTYQLVTLIALAVVFVIGGLAFATSYGRKFSDAAAAMATLGDEPWEANAPAADQLKLTLGRMQAMARARGVVRIPNEASPAALRALGVAVRGNRNRPSPLAAMRASRQYAREMSTQVKSARLSGYGALRPAAYVPPGPVMAVGGPVEEGMGAAEEGMGAAAAVGMAGAPAGPGAQ